jgi:hypothetical protein
MPINRVSGQQAEGSAHGRAHRFCIRRRGPLRVVAAFPEALAYPVAAIALTGGLDWINDERRDHGDE